MFKVSQKKTEISCKLFIPTQTDKGMTNTSFIDTFLARFFLISCKQPTVLRKSSIDIIFTVFHVTIPLNVIVPASDTPGFMM